MSCQSYPKSCLILLLMATVLLAGGCSSLDSSTNQLSNATGRLFDNISGRTPRKAAVKMEDQNLADARREGINQLVSNGFGRRNPYLERYQQIARTDDDWLVRATAVRALNRSRDVGSVSLFVSALSDKSDQVRLEACKALVHLPDASAVPALVKIVQDAEDNRDVRIAAADALQHYRTLEVARALTNTLGGRDFGVAWQAHKTLSSITGRDLSYDEAAWLAFLTGPEKPFG